MDHGALNHPLESGCGARVLPVGHDEAVQFLVDEVLEIVAQGIDIDIAAGEDGERIAILGQGQQQMLERGKFVRPLTRQVHRLVEGLFQSAGE